MWGSRNEKIKKTDKLGSGYFLQKLKTYVEQVSKELHVVCRDEDWDRVNRKLSKNGTKLTGSSSSIVHKGNTGYLKCTIG